jgi:hypothetical protein
LTLHGSHLDDIRSHWWQANRVIAVCPAIRDRLISAVPALRDRIVVLPNGVDEGAIPPTQRDRRDRRIRPYRTTADRATQVVGVIGRLDSDRSSVFEHLRSAWLLQATEGGGPQWLLAGDGNLRAALQEHADDIWSGGSGRQFVDFLGWLHQPQLAALCSTADAIVASGRSALEAVATGVPVIAAGAHHYVGPVDRVGFEEAAYTNFGDCADPRGASGDGHRSSHQLYEDVRVVLHQTPSLTPSPLGRQYLQRHVDEQLLELYELLRRSR